MRFPSIKAVRKELVKIHKSMRPNFKSLIDNEGYFEGVDVRLQVINYGAWTIHTGYPYPSLDLSPHGYWGTSFMTAKRENLEDLARSLIGQAKCHMQECAG